MHRALTAKEMQENKFYSQLMPEQKSLPAITGVVDHTNAIQIFPEALQPFRATTLAYGSSTVSTFIGFPMDTIKTRMQTHPEFKSYLQCVKVTFASDGLRGFYRGIWAPLFSNALSKSLNVSIFTLVKPHVFGLIFDSDSRVNSPLLRNIPVCFVSGAIAGSCTSIFATPFEFTKIYAQLETLLRKNNKLWVDLDRSTSTRRMASKIIKYEGVSGLYSGFGYHFLRDSLYSGLFYSLYETIKFTTNEVVNSGQSSAISILLAGGLSGVIGWAVAFPIDSAKSIIQKDIVSNILRKHEGLTPLESSTPRFQRNIYRGMGSQMMRSVVVSTAFFSIYEMAMAHVV